MVPRGTDESGVGRLGGVSDGLFDIDEAPATPVEPAGAGSPLAARMRPRTHRRGRRPGAPAAARCAAAPARRGRHGGVGAALRPARHREDDDRAARGWRGPALRRALGAVVRGQGPARRDRRRAPPPGPVGAGHGPVHRRGAPLLEDPAGRAARCGRGPGGAAGRRDHGEPVVLGGVGAALALADPAAAGADRRRPPRAAAPRGHRRARAGGHRRAGGRRRRTRWSGWPRGTPAARSPRWRSPRTGSPAPATPPSTSRRSSGRSTRSRCATTARATSTTT